MTPYADLVRAAGAIASHSHAKVVLDGSTVVARTVFGTFDSLVGLTRQRLALHPSRDVGIVSVGYEGQRIEQFVDRLRALRVDTVADVRLTPVSRQPGFSKRKLAAALANVGITYVHLKELGNPKENRAAFRAGPTDDGRTRFQTVLSSKEARDAIARLSERASQEVVAVLCVERDASRCHRQMVVDEVAAMSRQLRVSFLY